MTSFRTAAVFTALGFAIASLAGSLQAAPDKTLGVAVMAASVNQLGTLIRSAGAVSAENIDTGAVRVTFDRKVLGKCTYVANAEGGAAEGGAFVRVDETISNPKSVLVYTRNAQNIEENRSFELIVFCPN